MNECDNLIISCRASLREGARVLVDEDDRETYDLVLTGDYVPSKNMTKIISYAQFTKITCGCCLIAMD